MKLRELANLVPTTPATTRRGMALLIVMVLTMLIALGAYRFSFYMQSQYRVTRVAEEQSQARLAALSGVEIAASILELSDVQRQSMGSLVHNAGIFREKVIDSSQSNAQADAESAPNVEQGKWRVSVIAPSHESVNASMASSSPGLGRSGDVANAAHRYGLENESAKLHIPTLLQWEELNPGSARIALLRLPGATESLVDQWLRRHGVIAQNASGGLSQRFNPVSSLNGRESQQSSVDLLAYHWCGGDLNQNYIIDPLELRIRDQTLGDENIGNSNQLAGVTSDAKLATFGWQRYLTWESGQRNENRFGEQRIYLNDADLTTLHRRLTQAWSLEWANFVIAIRQFGISSEKPSVTVDASSWTPDFAQAASYNLASITELLTAVVVVPSSSSKQLLINPFSSDISGASNYLDRLLDEGTLETSPALVGRIDVMEAPLEVLSSVPGVDSALAESIVQRRASQNAQRGSIAWLLQEKLVTVAQLKHLERFLISRSDVYSFQAVGYRDELSPMYRCTVTVDARQIPARILDHRAWHSWDRGFTIEKLSGIEDPFPR